MLEVNANAALGPAVLSSSSQSALTVDGPEGFELRVSVVSGDSVQVVKVDGTGERVGRPRTVKAGESASVKDRSRVWLSGDQAALSFDKVA